MSIMQTLRSQQDASVNFIDEALVGFIESRYVRKVPEYFIAYLSSQSGCNRGCQFCHLTVTGQTSFVDSGIGDFMAQWANIEKHYMSERKPAKYVHFNFMARGEPLANKHLLERGDELLVHLGNAAKYRNLKAKFNISTIMPLTLHKSLVDVFNYTSPTMYYSLYSSNPDFREKWLPAAMKLDEALRMLKEYQDFSKKIIKIHHCFIKDENDSEDDVMTIFDMLHSYGIAYEFNLVRYNPFSPVQGEESDMETINRNMSIIKALSNGKVQIIPRVGPDVKASCGMFVE